MTIISAPDAATSSTSSDALRGRTRNLGHRPSPLVTAVWLLVIIGLGVFAPGVERSLSGAGWQADQLRVRRGQDSWSSNTSTAGAAMRSRSSCTARRTLPLTEGDGPQVIARVSQMLEPGVSSHRRRATRARRHRLR